MENAELNPEINSQINSLNDLGQKAAEAQNESRTFMDPKPPKSKRGRPKKEKPEDAKTEEKANPDAPPPIDPTFIMLSQQMCGVVSSTVVSVTGIPQNAMTPEERGGGEAILAALLQKYAPTALSAYGLEISALTVFGMYFWRVKMQTDAVIAEKIKMKEAQEKAQHDAQMHEAVVTQTMDPQSGHFPQAVTQ